MGGLEGCCLGPKSTGLEVASARCPTSKLGGLKTHPALYDSQRLRLGAVSVLAAVTNTTDRELQQQTFMPHSSGPAWLGSRPLLLVHR